MPIATVVIANGALALLLVAALAAVRSVRLRVHRTSNAGSIVPAAPTPLELHDELPKAA